MAKTYLDYAGLQTLVSNIKTLAATAKTTVSTAAGSGLAVTATTDDTDNHVDYAIFQNLKFTYVEAVTGDTATPAHIELQDATTSAVIASFNISDIVGNGMLSGSEYDETTGVLTLTFNQADGSTKAVAVDLTKMIDINDILIADGSADYLQIATATTENGNATFGVKIVNLANASDTATGLADAYDVKSTIDAVSAATNSLIAGLDKASTSVASSDAHVSVTYSETDGIVSIDSVATSDIASAALLGTAADTSASETAFGKIALLSADTAAAIAELSGNTDTAIKALDADVTGVTADGFITANIVQTDGKVTSITLEDVVLALADATGTTKGLAEATDVKATIESAISTSNEAVNDLSAATHTTITNLNAEVTAEDAGVTVTVVEAAGKLTSATVAVAANAVTYTAAVEASEGVEATAAKLAAADTTAVLLGDAIAPIKSYVDATVGGKNVSAAGDTFVSATAADNTVTVVANQGELTITAGAAATETTEATDTTISGDADKFVAGDKVATAISTFANARISEEIAKLDATFTVTAEDNNGLALSITQTDGVVTAFSGSIESITDDEIAALFSTTTE